MNARMLLTPFRFLWKRAIVPVFQWIDRGLVQIASLFGALEPDMLRRVLWMNGVFLGLYAISVLSIEWVSLAALVFAYIGVLAIGRAWVADEKLRTRIVKKLDNTNPDTLPDLRGAALVSALHLLILFPLLLWQLSKQFPDQLFRVHGGASFGDWLEFAFDPYAKFLFDQIEGHDHSLDITTTSATGRFIVLLKRLTLDFILIQGVLRLFAIHTTIQEGVGALARDPDITIRLGKRAITPLTEVLKGEDPHLRAQAALVLGQLKATRAIPDLTAALNDPVPEVRWRAVTALGEIGDPNATPAMLHSLRDDDATTARAALDALIALDAKVAIGTLRELLAGKGSPGTRALAAEGLRHLAGKDAVEPLLVALRDSDEDVSKTAAASLGLLGDSRAVEPLGVILRDATVPIWLRYEAAKALGELGDVAASPALQIALRDTDPQLRRLAVRALAAVKDPASGPVLLAALKDPAAEVREAAASAVGALKLSEGTDELVGLLGDPRPEVGEAAEEGLVGIGGMAVRILEAALGTAGSEQRARIEAILKRLKE